jgi:hypothetical protein
MDPQGSASVGCHRSARRSAHADYPQDSLRVGQDHGVGPEGPRNGLLAQELSEEPGTPVSKRHKRFIGTRGPELYRSFE